MKLIHPRLRREYRTMAAMLRIYCRARHRHHQGLCGDCRSLLDYAGIRLSRCVFGEHKPTCANCPVHCYRARERQQVRDIMRFAGPRMLWRHPVLALRHLMDGRRSSCEPSATTPARRGSALTDGEMPKPGASNPAAPSEPESKAPLVHPRR